MERTCWLDPVCWQGLEVSARRQYEVSSGCRLLFQLIKCNSTSGLTQWIWDLRQLIGPTGSAWLVGTKTSIPECLSTYFFFASGIVLWTFADYCWSMDLRLYLKEKSKVISKREVFPVCTSVLTYLYLSGLRNPGATWVPTQVSSLTHTGWSWCLGLNSPLLIGLFGYRCAMERNGAGGLSSHHCDTIIQTHHFLVVMDSEH